MKDNIEEDMEYINRNLDSLIDNARNLPELTATAVVFNKQSILLQFQKILIEYRRLKEKNEKKDKMMQEAYAKANKYDALVEKIEEIFKNRRLKILQENEEPKHDVVLNVLQELMKLESEDKQC